MSYHYHITNKYCKRSTMLSSETIKYIDANCERENGYCTLKYMVSELNDKIFNNLKSKALGEWRHIDEKTRATIDDICDGCASSYCEPKGIISALHRPIRFLEQVKCIEIFKKVESKNLRRDVDIDWKKAAQLWVSMGYAEAFGDVYIDEMRNGELYSAILAQRRNIFELDCMKKFKERIENCSGEISWGEATERWNQSGLSDSFARNYSEEISKEHLNRLVIEHALH